MVPFDTSWERYCKTAFIKMIDGIKGDCPLFVEGFERNTETLPEWFELRIDGPDITELAKQQWRLYFEVNVLINVVEGNSNAYRINDLTSRIANGMLVAVQVVNAAPLLIGCLQQLKTNADRRSRTSHFGKIRPDTRIIQATVESHYEIYFD